MFALVIGTYRQRGEAQDTAGLRLYLRSQTPKRHVSRPEEDLHVESERAVVEMESTSVIQQNRASQRLSPQKKGGRFPKVLQKWLDKP